MMTAVRSIHLVLSAALLLSPVARAVLPLRDQWSAACRLISSGDAARAAACLSEFNAWYADEPEARDPAFREGFLRLWGLASLQAGLLEDALPLLEDWLEEFPGQPRNRAFIRFQLASGYRSAGLTDNAVAHWSAFLEEHPELPETALVHWMWADQLVSESRLAEARSHLLAAMEEQRLPPTGRMLAQAALALTELAEGNQQQAFTWLDGKSETGELSVLRLWRALLAPSLASRLLESECHEEALRAGEWMDRPEALELQFARLVDALPAPRHPSAVRSAIWSGHWDGQIRRLDSLMANTGSEGDTTAGLYLLRLRTLLKAARAEQALVLAEALLLSDSSFAASLRSTAYGSAIEACRLLEDWQRADSFASEFLRDFPDHPDLPEILFQRARTCAARRQYTKAIELGGTLIATYPDNRALRSWQVATAGWLLQAGKPADALEQFSLLETSCPDSWQPYLILQQGTCLDQLKRPQEAGVRFEQVLATMQATPLVREQAFAGLLKLFMRMADGTAFAGTLERYRREFPQGLNRLMVENLAGTWLMQTGRKSEAVTVFEKVALEDDPAALFAHEQLSHMYGSLPDSRALRSHAIAWIRQALARQSPVPRQPFRDALLFQRKTGQAAFPAELVRTLLEQIEASTALLPAQAFLDVIAVLWEAYRELLDIQETSPLDWAQRQAADYLREGRLSPYTGFQLFNAGLLDREGRMDSADARRIEILRTVPPDHLGEDGLFAVATTAHRYDFPAAAKLLGSFLDRFPASENRPQGLYQLAVRERSDGSRDAAARLGEILTDWPDAAVYADAALASAQWHLEDNQAGSVEPILAGLLDRSGLPAEVTARALLLRARADFATGQPERAALNCRRLLTLYPDFHDISTHASTLLKNNGLACS